MAREQDAVQDMQRALLNNALQDKVELKQYYDLRGDAHRSFVAKTLRAKLRPLKIFQLSTRPSPAQLRVLYLSRRQFYVDIAPLTIPGRDTNGLPVEVPVTVSYPAESEEHSYHCVEFTRPRDGAIFEVLVRQADNYAVASRVYFKRSERAETPWCVLSDCSIPSTFGKQHPKLKYSSTHDRLDSVRFSVSILDQIFELLESLQQNPEQAPTPEGMRLLVTLFLFLVEAQRFAQLQQFFITNIESEILAEVDPFFCDLFRIWANLSKLCFDYHLAELEKPLFDDFLARMKPSDDPDDMDAIIPPSKSISSMRTLMAKKTLECKGKLDHSNLCGGEILLLNQDITLCLDIILRVRGYTGRLFNRKQSQEIDALQCAEAALPDQDKVEETTDSEANGKKGAQTKAEDKAKALLIKMKLKKIVKQMVT